jgi:hypothetical protein
MVKLDNRFLYPVIISLVVEQMEIEKKLAIESILSFVGVDVHEVTSVKNGKTVTAKKPLVDLHLPFIRILPFIIEGNLTLAARCLVIDDDERSFRRHPHVIESTANEEVRLRMEILDPLKVTAPCVEIGMRKWHSIDLMLTHDGVRLSARPIAVEFPLEEEVNCTVEREGRAVRTLDAKSPVEVQTARTLKKKLDLRAAHTERLGAAGFVEIS